MHTLNYALKNILSIQTNCEILSMEKDGGKGIKGCLSLHVVLDVIKWWVTVGSERPGKFQAGTQQEKNTFLRHQR